ncbi:MAG: hypothetical protein KGL39_35140 [Patescibacteria group bacterium]|nr:hypothetical protein [Patescibacteria group bacterium]
MANELQQAVPGNTILASVLNQLIQMLTGQSDVGAVNTTAPQPLPTVPTLAQGAAGSPNGAYKGILVNVTGIQFDNGTLVVSGFAPSAEASVTVVNSQINWTIGTGPEGTIARVLFRTVAGGASGTEKFAMWVGNNTQTIVADNVTDASLGTGMPNSNSSPPVIGNAIPSAVPTTNTTGTPWTFGSEALFQALAVAQGGVQVTTSGAAHSFTWQYNATTNSLELVYA